MTALFRQSAHSYFTALQKTYEKQSFLRLKIVPQLLYNELSDEEIESRLVQLPPDSVEYANLEIVQASHRLRRQPSPEAIETFRALNESMYGVPSRELSVGIMVYMMNTRHHNPGAKEWEYIVDHTGSLLNNKSVNLPIPSSELFLKLKKYLYEFVDIEMIKKSHTAQQALRQALEFSGLKDLGWKVVEKPGFMHARTVHSRKHLLIGSQYSSRRKMSRVEVAVHEVYGHALRGPQGDIRESEGFALVLEQLCNDSFKMKRSYRYLAAALAWGVTGERMDFTQVYEIIWRLMKLYARYDLESARSHAYDEVARVFRGGLPSEPGAVFLKDQVYFEANMAVWGQFIKHPPTYKQFISLINGEEKVLS